MASVSVDYVVRLEQGRSAAPSVQVCAALARVLQLSEAEEEHLLRLAGHASGGGRISQEVPDSIRRLVERTVERPVAVFDAMWNLLLWNPLWAATHGPPAPAHSPERNLLWLHFAGTSDCHLYGPNTAESLDASLVGDLRRSAGRYPEHPQLRDLVVRLTESSTRFSELWSRHDVDEHSPTLRRVIQTSAGLLDLDCDILLTQRRDLRVMLYTAEPGSSSEAALAQLAGSGPAESAPEAVPAPER